VKGLNFTIFPLVLEIEDILNGDEKAISILPVEAVEDIQ